MKKILPVIKPLICAALCIAAVVVFLCFAFNPQKSNAENNDKSVLQLWQIDSFEGGKGSRADYLQKKGNAFSKEYGAYVTVTALSAEAAVLNLENGNIPDLISYGAGICGLESYIGSFTTWCHGGYCLLAVDGNADFTDVNAENTVINSGKNNYTAAAAMFYGLQNAECEKPSGAYVKLINGDYKYLLGTQRDIFRLKTRGVGFTVKPVTEFNDLYQNISVVDKSANFSVAQRFVGYLMSHRDDVNKLGLMTESSGLYDDEMKVMEGLDYECKVVAPVNKQTKERLENIIAQSDINMLKNLLK